MIVKKEQYQKALEQVALYLLKFIPAFIIRLLPIASLVNTDRVRSSIKRMFRNLSENSIGTEASTGSQGLSF